MGGVRLSSGVDVRIDRCHSARDERDWLGGETRAEQDELRVLFCHYREPAVIFGLSQRPDTALQRRLDKAGVDWMRRRAGGGTVYAGPWLLGVSVILPSHHPMTALEPVQAYRWFGGLWQRALGALGCPSQLPDRASISASQQQARDQGVNWACYGALGHGELASDEAVPRKILGIAQVRTRTSSTLVAGLNLTAVDWPLLCELLARPAIQGTQLKRKTASLAELVRVGDSATAEALANRIEPIFVAALRRDVAVAGASSHARPVRRIQ